MFICLVIRLWTELLKIKWFLEKLWTTSFNASFDEFINMAFSSIYQSWSSRITQSSVTVAHFLNNFSGTSLNSLRANAWPEFRRGEGKLFELKLTPALLIVRYLCFFQLYSCSTSLPVH